MSETPVANLPEPNAGLVLRMAEMSANVRFIRRKWGKKDAERYLSDISEALGLQEASYTVLRFRPRSEDPKMYEAMTEASAWWRQALGILIRSTE